MGDTPLDQDQDKSVKRNGVWCNEMSLIHTSRRDDEIHEETKILEEDTKCGIGCFYPKWLQIFASKKSFVLIYALAGMQQMIVGSYYVGIMSTTEKNFSLSSQQSGIITAAWDLGSLFTNIIITYVAAKGHRTRWVAFGTLLIGISSLMRVLPYYIFGPGEITKMYTKEYQVNYSNMRDVENVFGNSTELKKLSTNVNCEKDNDFSSVFSFYTFLTAQIILGVGTAVYWTCGATYLDDNVRKNIVPALLAIVQAIRLFGPTIGYLLSSYALNIYVDPRLTPLIGSEDPRWIGAWWIGWYPIGIMSLVLSLLLFLFPKSLPRAAERKQNTPDIVTESSTGVSIKDFRASMTRILKNKIIVFNSFSAVCFTMGLGAYWTFMPKYMETQFRLSPSKSNFLTGTVGILCNALGVMAAGLIISKLKPSPRYLAGWNVLVEFLDVIGYASYSFMSCPQQEYHGHWNSDHIWNLTETCNADLGCGNDIQFAPVCDVTRELAFYSPCHAGCNASYTFNGTTSYTGCSCVPGGKVIDGLCPTDCSSNILIFILVMGTLSFTSATGRSANTLIQFRCVEERDKSLSIGVTEALLSLLAFIPSPIFYGMIMDWTCIVWGDNCGTTGNCWLYDGHRLRSVFNMSAAAFLLIGTVLDCFVWYHVKGLKIYDEDFIGTKTEVKKKTPIVKNTHKVTEADIELPLIRSHHAADS